jgi:eukaryotic-like serine/threonine-protein kinase
MSISWTAKYEILGEIGQGGMGRVYLARQKSPVRLVALKVIGRTGDAGLRSRFLREANLLAGLQHPNLAQVLEVVTDDSGSPVIVMPYLSGGSIGDILARDGKCNSGETVAVLAPVAEALGVIHRHGVIHRDIKPSNILLDGDGSPYLADFGIASIENDGAAPATTTTQMIGTVGYSAPELADGEDATPASDVWSLGVLGYQMLTGMMPFGGKTISSVLKAVSTAEFTPILERNPDTNSSLAGLVESLLKANPSERPTDLAALARDLRAASPPSTLKPVPMRIVESHETAFSVTPKRAEVPVAAPQTTKRKTKLLVGVAAALTLGGVALAASVFGGSKEKTVAVATIEDTAATDTEIVDTLTAEVPIETVAVDTVVETSAALLVQETQPPTPQALAVEPEVISPPITSARTAVATAPPKPIAVQPDPVLIPAPTTRAKKVTPNTTIFEPVITTKPVATLVAVPVTTELRLTVPPPTVSATRAPTVPPVTSPAPTIPEPTSPPATQPPQTLSPTTIQIIAFTVPPATNAPAQSPAPTNPPAAAPSPVIVATATNPAATAPAATTPAGGLNLPAKSFSFSAKAGVKTTIVSDLRLIDGWSGTLSAGSWICTRIEAAVKDFVLDGADCNGTGLFVNSSASLQGQSRVIDYYIVDANKVATRSSQVNTITVTFT